MYSFNNVLFSEFPFRLVSRWLAKKRSNIVLFMQVPDCACFFRLHSLFLPSLHCNVRVHTWSLIDSFICKGTRNIVAKFSRLGCGYQITSIEGYWVDLGATGRWAILGRHRCCGATAPLGYNTVCLIGSCDISKGSHFPRKHSFSSQRQKERRRVLCCNTAFVMNNP